MTKEYEKTHPWIDFNINLEKASINLPMLLGSAQSKCKHIANALIEPNLKKELYTIYMAKGARATTAIEGNTLSEDDVLKLMDKTLTLPKSKKYLGNEVDNALEAFNKIAAKHIETGASELSVEEIKKYNKMTLEGLDLEQGVFPGEIRRHSVGVGKYRGAPAKDCEYLLEKLCKMLNAENFSLGEGWEVATGILKAIVAHLYIAWIHPFGDGNGRTARMVEFKICLSSGIAAPAVHLLSNHYNETREGYYRALDKTSQQISPLPFIEYALQGYVDQLDEQIERIRHSQYKAFWENYIYKTFRDKDSAASRRKRLLALEVSNALYDSGENEGITISKIPDLTPKLARDYAKKTFKTLEGDVRELVNIKLLIKEGNKVRPNTKSLLFFLPPVAKNVKPKKQA